MTEAMYRTPVGTQSETTTHDACDNCGDPLDPYDLTIQGHDPEQPIVIASGARLRHCHACTIALLSGTDTLRRPSDDPSPSDPHADRCEECELPMVPKKRPSRFCGRRCRVANSRKSAKTGRSG